MSRWGCAALAALAYKHTINQSKLTTACNYLADILEVHYKNALVAKEACRAISVLCHGHITNRNKLGMRLCICDMCIFALRSTQYVMQCGLEYHTVYNMLYMMYIILSTDHSVLCIFNTLYNMYTKFTLLYRSCRCLYLGAKSPDPPR